MHNTIISMEKIKLAVFHYHFVPGGITTVVKLSLISLLENLNNIEKIVLVSGRDDNAENLVSVIKSSVSGEKNNTGKIEISWETVPEIDYVRDDAENDSVKESAITEMLEKYRGYIYWIHNHHIGKNPLFTKTAAEFAEKNSDEKFFFHIHDFPECSRYSNYRFLKKTVDNPYPSGSNIKYAVLNSRDYNYLKDAGIDDNSLFLLPNPVIQGKSGYCKMEKSEKKKIKEKLYRNTKGFFSFDPEKPVFLYPVRAIRRKNILEAGLITLLTGEGGNLIQTLPGISDQEISYSRTVSNHYRDGSIKGIWGTGITGSPAEADLKEIIGISDIIISSSVMEGFGYIFTDTISWGKPILSRYLETSEDFLPLFSENNSHFYKTFRIPLSPELKNRMSERIKTYFSEIDREISTLLSREDYIKAIMQGNTVDYSYLPSDIQGEILDRAVKSSEFRTELKEINSALLTKTLTLLQSEPDITCRDISEYFGPGIFAENFKKIVNSYRLDSPCTANHSGITEKLLLKFTTHKSVRLINGPG